MALKNLTTREMAKVGADLVRPGSKEREALEAVPAAAHLIPILEETHAALVKAQPPSETELQAIIDRITELDARHDDLVRSILDRLASERTATKNPATEELMSRLSVVLVPEGRALVMRSYLEEAGAAVLREERVNDEHRAALAKLKTYDGESYLTLYNELQDVSAEIGRLERSRTIIEAEDALVVKTRDARNRWIAAINTLANVLALVGVDEDPILLTIRKAAHKAGLRAQKHAAAERAKKAALAGQKAETAGTETDVADTGATETRAADTGAADVGAADVGAADVNAEPDDLLDPPMPSDEDA